MLKYLLPCANWFELQIRLGILVFISVALLLSSVGIVHTKPSNFFDLKKKRIVGFILAVIAMIIYAYILVQLVSYFIA